MNDLKTKFQFLIMKLSILLIVINVLIFFYSLTNFPYYIEKYGFIPSSFLSREYYRIFTSIFLHGSIWHLLYNMLALFFLGSAIETKIKSWQYMLVYLIGGILANLVMLIPIFASPDSIGVGASGAISALIGLGTFFSPGKFVLFPTIIPVPFVVAGAIFFLGQSVNLFTKSYIAYPVHLAGMIIGSLFGLKWSEDKGKKVFIFLLTLVMIMLLPYLIRFIIWLSS